MEEKRAGHILTMQNREELVITGIQHVVNYDEQEIVLETRMGKLLVRGEGLAITRLDVADGEIAVHGLVTGLAYTEQGSKGKNVWRKLLR